MVDLTTTMLLVLGGLFVLTWISKFKDRRLLLGAIILGIVHITLHLTGARFVFPDDPVSNFAIYVTLGLMSWIVIYKKFIEGELVK
jgi:hypothetical protein|tara:strand:+ start:14686 stop:14943 length:258 start_codon:yes stop_codon:yes gene_type:complete